MKLSRLARENLHGDRNVQGKRWKRATGGYWHKPAAANAFVRLCKKRLDALPEKPNVLELGSADGFLGEYVCRYLRAHGKRPTLTLVDMSKAHLRENKNRKTKKIQADLLTLNLKGQGAPFDLILMRSVLHYFPTRALQVRILKRVLAHLAPGGVFLNQAFIAATPQESKLRSNRHASLKTGARYMPYYRDIPTFYAQAGFGTVKDLGKMPLVRPSLADYAKRTERTPTELLETRAKYERIPARLRPHLILTKTAFERTIPYRVYAATCD